MKFLRILGIILLLIPFNLLAQKAKQDTTLRIGSIIIDSTQSDFIFRSKLPELHQIAGAPKAFYTYFWEFGDGNYSFSESPEHSYSKNGDYTVYMSATNNYDDGLPPTARPVKISAPESSVQAKNNSHKLIENHDGFRLQTNRDPSPNQNMDFILSYGNEKSQSSSGKVFLFYNEKKYKDDNFDLVTSRFYHDEKEQDPDSLRQSAQNPELTNALNDAYAIFRDFKVYNFDSIQPQDERNIFYTFKTTPEMIKDTSAILAIRSIYVPDSRSSEFKVLDKEMEIVTSHDPNKMAVNNSFLNYRFSNKKKLTYKVKFQNNGEGPAKTIRLNVDVPDLLDKSTLEIVDMYPKCQVCPKEEVNYSCLDTIILDDKIVFEFKNIYLPGSAQKGVQERDSTKGFVKYTIRLADKVPKKAIKCRTDIIFDKNDPIRTNTATTRYLPGLSIGIKAGYNSFPDLINSKDFFGGFTLSPYKSYRKYLQAEIMFSRLTYDLAESTTSEVIQGLELANGVAIKQAIAYTSSSSNIQQFNIDLVPVSFRYNINGIIGLGVGPQFSIDLSTKNKSFSVQEYYTYNNQVQGRLIEEMATTSSDVTNSSFGNIKMRIFGDITVGSSRVGPSIGVRYIQGTEKPMQQWQFYAIWKI